ncbi:hypothetical protein JAO76_09265 [Pontibacter sp. BT310]|uniref:Uncharacterized protein n=1 Tax=Pontibacter populi TaxID=890055 RepID=A0ABS6XB69_9BACT|nr:MULTISPECIES: hypothetical protein [Pontibacter]MBJ6118380.1 hypothetical protein [Pontibacter sp. BT310]MBR0570807.1 hypothetical protein [Microvirga sp. STS03]MBW3365233.1 hypothetical protein [Pontibacter populi]
MQLKPYKQEEPQLSNDFSLWVERLVDFWCRQAFRGTRKGNVRRAMPEDGASRP